jgi:V/A-type H+-transporting ATPase subunit I
MIVPMTKYTFVVVASGRADFLSRLQELGLVDITTTGWEPTDEDREMMALADRHREAATHLRTLPTENAAAKNTAKKPKPFTTGAEALAKYEVARGEMATLEAELDRLSKLADEVRPWGDFDSAQLSELTARGIDIRLFTAPTADFEKRRAEWSESHTIEPLNEIKGTTYFAALTARPETKTKTATPIDAQETKLPPESAAKIEARIQTLHQERQSWKEVIARAAASLEKIEAEGELLTERLHMNRTATSGEQAADGSLVIMEAWAREKQQTEVDTLLDESPEVLFIKARPTPHDNTPVELSNPRVVRPFEFIAQMYALPRYGTMDLTRWFAPFYMLFFAFCLADTGYGLAIFLGGLILTLKSEGAMATIGKLSMWCGGAGMVFGFLVGSFFGIDIKQWSMFEGAPIFFPTDGMFLFGLALALGVFQIIFGLTLKAITSARAFGVKYALSTIGWIIVLLTGITMMAPGLLGIELAIPPIAFHIAIGVGAFMMLFLNNPGKNPLVNFGGGLWNTYNDVTGFLSDALSYIRLFAIGLSGGVLAMVFNDLAMGLSPDIPVAKQLVALVILLIGHGLNLFMSALSSMVHPLRLTFVEFYKNAGFEMTTRTFDPLKKANSKK